MTIDAFLQGLSQRGLCLEVDTSPEGINTLVLSGEQGSFKDGIRKFIREHKKDLIDHLLAIASNASPMVDTSAPRHVPCCLSEYGECSNLVIEQDESTWRMSPDGLVFCLECWQSRNIEQAERAHSYLADHDQPTDLGTRIERIMNGPGYGCCGGRDWRVDHTGILVCHHVIEGQAGIKTLPARKSMQAASAA